MNKNLRDQIMEEALRARTRIYAIGEQTPVQKITLPQETLDDISCQVFVKREDLGPINAYKWRGAYNSVYVHHKNTNCKTVVAASAGNHAQGVALAARKLGIQSKIFMPLATPLMKQTSVQKHGQDNVEVILNGDTFEETSITAKEYCEKNEYTYIHPFDDIYTIAGQATIADEIMLSEEGPFDVAFIQIGGGGIAAGIASWLKIHNPNITIIGVEGTDQASMKASFKAGKPITLDAVDKFCDGTAVKRPGDLTFEICQEYLDDIITVSNEEVSAAIQTMWETSRVIPEPSGAMGLAGLIQYARSNAQSVKNKKLLSIICGANMDFSKLSLISRQSAVGAHRRRYLQLHLNEQKGGLLGLLDSLFANVSVSEFLYGKRDEKQAWPIIAFEASPEQMEEMEDDLKKADIVFSDVTSDPDIRYRIINYDTSLFKNPLMMHIHFPERQGALRDFLRQVSGLANICYFNYQYSGESIGRALMGFEFEEKRHQEQFFALLENSVVTGKEVHELAAKRILGVS